MKKKKKKVDHKAICFPCVPSPGFLKAAFYYVKILLNRINYRFYVTMAADVMRLIILWILNEIWKWSKNTPALIETFFEQVQKAFQMFLPNA